MSPCSVSSHSCVLPQVYHELKKYEGQRTANKSTYWIQVPPKLQCCSMIQNVPL